MQEIFIQYHKSVLGELILGSFEEKLCLLDFSKRAKRSLVDKRLQQGLSAKFVQQDSALLQEARQQVDAYLAGNLRKFSLPLLCVGTSFQESVWEALKKIPYAETASYLELARAVGRETAHRAVANANGANALAIVIPCHRVIATSGALGGYGGGLEQKRFLLDLEKKQQKLEVKRASSRQNEVFRDELRSS